ncbi:MAG: MFS transporter [Proteobacteria bacterium]|nr:MFS transporter [Pseudomonadota bacterium]
MVLLTLPATAMGFALSVQISALSWILSTRYGLRLDEIGLVWAAGPLAGIVGQLLVGIVSDRVWLWRGRRRPFIVIGGLTAALMLLALPRIGLIARALGLESVLGVAVTVALALDLSINVSFNPTRSIIADVTREGPMRTRGYTWMQTVSGCFGVLAYAIGGAFDNDTLITVAAVLVPLLSVVPSLLVEEPRTLPGAGATQRAGPGLATLARLLMPLWAILAYDVVAMALRIAGRRAPGLWLEGACALATLALTARTLAARDRGVEFVKEDLVEFRKVLAAHAFSWIGVQTMFVYMIGFLQARFPDLGAARAGSVLSYSFLVLNAVGFLMPTLVLQPLTERFGQVAVHAACLALMAAAYAGLYLAGRSPAAIYALMALAGVGWAAIVSLPFAIMSQRVDQSRIGLYMGVFNLAVVLPQLLVSCAGSLLDAATDKSVLFLVSAGALALSATAWLFVRRAADGEAPPPPAPAH